MSQASNVSVASLGLDLKNVFMLVQMIKICAPQHVLLRLFYFAAKLVLSILSQMLHAYAYLNWNRLWAARYNTWLLTKLTPKGVVFSFLFFSSSTRTD